MTPAEKSDEICRKMLYKIEWNASVPLLKESAKQLALVAVDEILNVWENQQPRRFEEWLEILQYWQEVKQKIKKL